MSIQIFKSSTAYQHVIWGLGVYNNGSCVQQDVIHVKRKVDPAQHEDRAVASVDLAFLAACDQLMKEITFSISLGVENGKTRAIVDKRCQRRVHLIQKEDIDLIALFVFEVKERSFVRDMKQTWSEFSFGELNAS